jgi:membrane protease YdiL (CAAX protease family)
MGDYENWEYEPSKFAEAADRILFKIYGVVKKAAIGFKRQALSRRNLHYFLYYAIANLLILLLFSLYQSFQGVSLELKPVTSPVTEGSSLLFVAAVILLPFSLLLEELGFRLLPMFFIRDLFHLNNITISIEHEGKVTVVHHSPLRLWICHHWVWIFIVVSSVWAGLLHQINIVSSDLLGSLIYFGVQAFSGFCFAWIYSKRGLGASWAVHTAWDLFIVALNLIILL